MIERSHVESLTNQPLDDLELVDMAEHEIRLDAVRAQPLEVLDVKAGPASAQSPAQASLAFSSFSKWVPLMSSSLHIWMTSIIPVPIAIVT